MPRHIAAPVRVTAAGHPPKTIDEYVGRVNTQTGDVSIAHMKSPAGWVEPAQTPEFDEYTLVLRGMLRVEHDGGALDVRDGRVVKGVRFRDHVDMGDIETLAQRYRDEGADELVFYDITASPQGRSADRDWVERVARLLDIPFCVAGGIRSVEDARAILHAGADKVSINTPALERPELIAELADAFGVQCVVVGIRGFEDLKLREYLLSDPTTPQTPSAAAK